MSIFKHYKGTYWFSDDGKAYNTNYHSTKETRELGYDYSRKGYPSVTLSIDGKIERRHLHKYIAELFVPNPNGYSCVDHINDDKTDARACNLRWVSVTENNQKETKRELLSKSAKGHKHSDETRKKQSLSAKNRHTKDRVILEVGSGKIWNSPKEAADYYGVCPDTIGKCARGQRKTAVGGRRFIYIDRD